jgi:hypothetical protein
VFKLFDSLKKDDVVPLCADRTMFMFESCTCLVCIIACAYKSICHY